jgi:long-subunit fatty acid transport protein
LLALPILLVPDTPCAYTIGQSVGIASSPNPVGSGARAVGMGGAFIAVADDATAASWNPAGLSQLETPEISIVGAQVFTSDDFFSPSNPVADTRSHTDESSINYFSASYPFNFLNKNMVVSLNYQRLYEFKRHMDYNLAMSTPPPLSLVSRQTRSYEQNGYLSALGLACGIQITPSISLGATLNLWTGGLGWRNGWEESYTNHSVTTLGLTKNIEDSLITEKYSDPQGVNMNFGVLWNATPQFTVGAVLKTPFSAKFDHQYTDDWIQRDGLGNVKNSAHVYLSDEVELRLPLSYGIGLAWRFSDRLTIDLDLYRTHWSEYILTDGQGNRMSPINALPESKSDIKDTTQVRIGGEYLFIKPERDWVVSLRGGMFYDPEPDQGRVKDFYGISIGTGVSYRRYVFDFAYQLRWGKSVDAGNLIAGSEADIRQHLLLLSLIVHF